jgi:hypothetical protein
MSQLYYPASEEPEIGPAKLVLIARINHNREEVEDDLSQVPRIHGGGMAT